MSNAVGATILSSDSGTVLGIVAAAVLIVFAAIVTVKMIAMVIKVLSNRTEHRHRRSFSSPEEAAAFISRARECYHRHAQLGGRDYIATEASLRLCLLELTLRPSQVLVTDFIRRCSKDRRRSADLKSSPDEEDECAVGVGDFVLFAQLIKTYREGSALKRVIDARRNRLQGEQAFGSPAYWTRRRTEYQVFLGGSCNPTTWRKDLAVPALKAAGVTYYNPQMDEWGPHLVELEQQAKRCAQLKFFVIDNKTRGVASMVEIAHLAASKAQLIVVMQDFEKGMTIDGVTLSDREVLDLNRGHDFLCHLLYEHGIPLFDDVSTAIEYSIRLIQRGESIYDLGEDPYVSERVIRGADVATMDRAEAAFTQYCEHSTRTLSLREAQLAVKTLLGIFVSEEEFLVLLSHAKLDQSVRLTRDDFSCAVAGLLPQFSATATLGDAGNALRNILSAIVPAPTMRWILPQEPISLQYDVARDVFLGGSCGPLQRWREDVAIPLLRKNGIDYFNPNVENWTPQLIPLEAQAKKQCSVLLYFVGSDTRSVGSMVEAADFIGQDREVVLCLNDVAPFSMVESDEVGVRAAKDLNRGRLYLADIANRENLKIFNNVREATIEVIRIIQTKRLAGTAPAIASSPKGLITNSNSDSPRLKARSIRRLASRGTS